MTTYSEVADREDDGPLCFYLQRETADPEVVARFTLEGEPVSKQRPRFVRNGVGRTYTPEPTRVAEQRIAWAYRSAVGPSTPSEERNYGVYVGFFCSSGQRRDVDNLTKLVLDGLNKVAWGDDSQVTEISAKILRWQDQPRTEVVIYETVARARPGRTCEQCGETFPVHPSTSPDRKYCSRECKATATRRAVLCAHCGETFTLKASRATSGRSHCSLNCKKEAAKAKLVSLECAFCGATFTRRPSTVAAGAGLTCSPICRNKYRSGRTRSARAELDADHLAELYLGDRTVKSLAQEFNTDDARISDTIRSTGASLRKSGQRAPKPELEDGAA